MGGLSTAAMSRLGQAEEVFGEVVARRLPYFDQPEAEQVIGALAGELRLGDARLGWMLAAICWWVKEHYGERNRIAEWYQRHRIARSTFCEHAATFEAYYPGECALRRQLAEGLPMTKREFERRRAAALEDHHRVAEAPFWMHLTARAVAEPARGELLRRAQREGYSRERLRAAIRELLDRPERSGQRSLVAEVASRLRSPQAADYLDAVVMAACQQGQLNNLYGRIVLARLNLSNERSTTTDGRTTLPED